MTPRYYTIFTSFYVNKVLKKSFRLSNCLSNRRVRQGKEEYFRDYNFDLKTGWSYDHRHEWVETDRSDVTEICKKCGLED